MLWDGRPVEIGLFDSVSEVSRQGNITVFPREWIFRVSGGGLSGVQRTVKNVLLSIQMRAWYYSRLGNLLPSGDSAQSVTEGRHGPTHKHVKTPSAAVYQPGVEPRESFGGIFMLREDVSRSGGDSGLEARLSDHASLTFARMLERSIWIGEMLHPSVKH